jgi:membrane associated rhomboid family serine protease
MKSSPSYRITPWVGRLIIANAVVLLLRLTLFTSPEIVQALQFAPPTAFTHPWTFVTYMFVHAGLLHLVGNMLMLYVFGTAVENRMGSRNFILYYLFCGVGAAVFSLLLAGIVPISAFIGA